MRNGNRPRTLQMALLVLVGAGAAYVARSLLGAHRSRASDEMVDGSVRIRRDSLLDITDPERPTTETVLVAEAEAEVFDDPEPEKLVGDNPAEARRIVTDDQDWRG